MNENEYTTSESEAMSDRSKIYLNRRTGEVVPAGTDEVAGRIKKNRDGSYTAYFAGGGSRRSATEEGAVLYVINRYRS